MTHIKELAEAVQGWGNCTKAWLDTSEDASAAVVGHIDEDGNAYPVVVIDCAQYYAEHDSMKLARFYAAANPTAVLELLAESDQLRQQLAAARSGLEAEQKVASQSENEAFRCSYKIAKRNTEVAELRQQLAEARAEVEQAFREGFRSPATYNDVLVNCEDDEWENYKRGMK